MTVLITGANRGIGQELRKHYLAQGHEVFATTRCAAAEDSRHWIELDLADPSGFAGMARHLDSVPLDLLICNAGVYLDKGMALGDDYPAALWAESFAVNVTGVFLSVQALLPNLQLAPSAKIAVISSQMGSSARAPGGSYIYRASKAAATNLARNLASDLAPLGIAVGAFHPGWVRTDMGGQSADITLAQSVQGLSQQIERLDISGTGCFRAYDGTDLPF